ncbi:MAG TPA: hypothetical protein VFZ15_06240 [Acidimicrobiia bacterium]|nr:hypothetical protein [Acidimicrobiia bacterium]
MEPERNEVYERIPWETLEENKGDRHWLMLGVAGAVVLGALAYSFMSSRPAALPSALTTVPAQQTLSVQETVPEAPTAAQALPPTVSDSPVVTAEADLYAVHPERVMDRVAAHAEWFVAEYLTFDGSEQGMATLTALLPVGVPLPAAPEGTRVFVEWVRASSVEETAPLTYRVTVLARSLAAHGDGAYQRQAPLEVTVDLSASGGDPQVLLPPEMRPATAAPAHQPALTAVPEEVAVTAMGQAEGSEVIGGAQSATGEWQVVLLAPGLDGVSRPVTVVVPG